MPVQHGDMLNFGICTILATLYYDLKKKTDTEIPVRICTAPANRDPAYKYQRQFFENTQRVSLLAL